MATKLEMSKILRKAVHEAGSALPDAMWVDASIPIIEHLARAAFRGHHTRQHLPDSDAGWRVTKDKWQMVVRDILSEMLNINDAEWSHFEGVMNDLAGPTPELLRGLEVLRSIAITKL